ncbi:MAG: LacI family DNA-binding transcriptional regulator [Anaerolineaceae bacterium]|nr:LacI family DNA-binding transcriptional regulator [Anaerolineaceae bacterium]
MPKSKATRPTLLDVAEMSGVSYQTVSRVINNHPYVSDDARQRVEVAIEALGYRPNKVATKLRSKSSKTIAIILFGSWFHGPVQIALNVEMAARTNGYDVILMNVTDTQVQVVKALQHVNGWDIEGLIMIIPAQSVPMEEIRSICGDIPIVHIDSHTSTEVPSVALDEAYGTEQVIEHLISLGHTQFCEISGPLNWVSAQIRHETCIQVFRKHGLELPIHVEGNWTTPGGYQAMRRLLDAKHPFTAVISANDNMAFGAMRALEQHGLSVPKDISLVGFDDIPEAAYLSPPLTTVRHNYIQLGIVGFEYLLQLIDEHDAPIRQRLITPRLIIRESTMPVSKS